MINTSRGPASTSTPVKNPVQVSQGSSPDGRVFGDNEAEESNIETENDERLASAAHVISAKSFSEDTSAEERGEKEKSAHGHDEVGEEQFVSAEVSDKEKEVVLQNASDGGDNAIDIFPGACNLKPRDSFEVLNDREKEEKDESEKEQSEKEESEKEEEKEEEDVSLQSISSSKSSRGDDATDGGAGGAASGGNVFGSEQPPSSEADEPPSNGSHNLRSRSTLKNPDRYSPSNYNKRSTLPSTTESVDSGYKSDNSADFTPSKPKLFQKTVELWNTVIPEDREEEEETLYFQKISGSLIDDEDNCGLCTLNLGFGGTFPKMSLNLLNPSTACQNSVCEHGLHVKVADLFATNQ